MNVKIMGRYLFMPVSLVNKIIPKKKKQIFFYSNLGFRDNVKAVFDYLLEHQYNEKYQIVCSINDWQKYVQLQKREPEKYKNVRFLSNKAGIWQFLRSKYGFYSFGKYPIKPSSRQVIVNLWHGMPLKRIGNMEDGLKKVDYNYFTYVLATSELFADIMGKCFHCQRDQILLDGQPRNDEMFRKDYSSVKEAKTAEKTDQEMKNGLNKLFVWFPTYRNSEPLADEQKNAWPVPLITPEEAGRLNETLQKLGSKMIIKLHPLQYFSGLSQYTNIEILSQKDMEEQYGSLYRLLRLSDALITDYSSVYFDYLLLDRPIGFTVDDMEHYEQDRGFVFDKPADYMPGAKIHNADEFTDFLMQAAEGKDTYKEFRKKVNDQVNDFQDGESCRRILKKIGL